MADPLYELLIPYFDQQDASLQAIGARPLPSHAVTASYLARLATLPIAALTSSEQQSLSQSTQSIARSLQSLSRRSHKPIISSADHLAHLRTTLPQLGQHAGEVQSELPKLETAAQKFADKYSKSAENPLLDRRRKAMLLSRNIDRVSDILELPALLSSAVTSSTGPSQATASTTSPATNANYASALDLHAHIKRLHSLYPNSALVSSLAAQAEQEMKIMTANLVVGLQSQGIKLAGAMRTIGWLRRVAPELDEPYNMRKGGGIGTGEGALGALFLVCRLSNLLSTLDALDPLRELADQETTRRARASAASKDDASGWAGGQQTERYLKRYIEIFREQSFAIISMYKSIFPSALPFPDSSVEAPAKEQSGSEQGQHNPLQPIPSALATFPMHLVDLLFDTLKHYLPNVRDRSSRDSLLTQVLYCAGSLGRLGGDFSMMIALLEEDLREELGESGSDDDSEAEEEWVDIMKKHRVQASRLELLASGVGTGKAGGLERTSNPVH